MEDYQDGIPEEKDARKGFGWVSVFLILLPLGIAIGTCWGLYRHFNKEEELKQRASLEISSKEIKGILWNYQEHFGDRSFASEKQRETLANVSKNIAGELQYQNSFLLSYSDRGGWVDAGMTWKTHWADVKGHTDSKKVFVIATSYDGAANLRNASKIAIMVTVAKSLAGEELDYTLRFVFVPQEQSIQDQESWVKKQCIADDEKPVGMFFLAHGKGNEETALVKDSWSATEGDVSWAQELLKGSRVMSYGSSTLHHGVFNLEKVAEESETKRVENAARSLREIMIMIMGGDR